MTKKKTPDKLLNEWFKDVYSFDFQSTIETPKRAYEIKLIAWIDVLGMSKKIIDSGKDDSGADEIITNIEILKNCVENSCEELRKQNKLEYIQLNDGFIIVCELDCIDVLCRILCEIQWKILVEIKMPIRGALTAGQMITSNEPKVIIGPAFINAYILEDKNAIFPRILLSDEIYKYINKKKIKFKYISKDTDNLTYLDYLRYELNIESNLRDFDYKLKVHGIKQLILDNYKMNITSNTNIAQKYGWIISKLSELKIRINR